MAIRNLNNQFTKYYPSQTNPISEDRDVKRISSKYKAIIEESNYRFPSMEPNYRAWNAGTFEYTTQPGISISMSLESFRHFLDNYDELEHHRIRSRDYDSIIKQYRDDERARDNNPSVQKAYRNYLMLLELTRK